MDSLESGELRERILISVPAAGASGLSFPFEVVGSKAYMTRLQLSAAEDQAAIFRACALKIQLGLDKLLRASKPSLRRTNPQQVPMVCQYLRSIISRTCPHHLTTKCLFSSPYPMKVLCMWSGAHWTEVRSAIPQRSYNMMTLKCIYGSLSDGLLDFFVMVDNIQRWGTGHFQESMVTRLLEVARIVKAYG